MKSFVLYIDTFETLQHLTDEQLGKLTRMLFKYKINGESPDVSDPLFMAFGFIKTSMDRDADKWNRRAERSKENGAKGGRPKENKETQKTQQVILEPTKPVSVSASVSGSVSDSVNVSEKKIVISSFKNWTKEQFKNEVDNYFGKFPNHILKNFFEYWTEPTASGKIRMNLEKAWDTNRRLKAWASKEHNQPTQKPTFTRASQGVHLS